MKSWAGDPLGTTRSSQTLMTVVETGGDIKAEKGWCEAASPEDVRAEKRHQGTKLRKTMKKSDKTNKAGGPMNINVFNFTSSHTGLKKNRSRKPRVRRDYLN